jgi:4-hydroxy-tetrahydrodipicolinate synthase
LVTTLWDEARWACVAVVTPIDAVGRIDAVRLHGFITRLYGHGINGVVLFGTTGEGPAFSAVERLEATAKLIELGLDPDRIMLGIGSSAPSEMAWLARRSGELKLAGVLATPPFFFREVDQEGVIACYAAIVEGGGTEAPPLMLYHIPQVCGVPVTVDTTERLIELFPGRIRGIKDSEANIAHTRELVGRLAGRMTVVVGAEPSIPEAMAGGARGTICGMANLIPGAIARLVGGDASALAPVEALGAALEGIPGIPAVKAAVGAGLGDPAWSACVPPLRAASDSHVATLRQHTAL